MDIPILYEDNHLLCIEKPVNVPVQEDKTKDKDLLSILKEDIKYRYQKPGNVYLALVHRLDRPVGGTMVFAKTSKAASRLSIMMRRKSIDKNYLAVVRGTMPENHEVLEDYLVKNPRKNKVHTASSNNENAKKAVLEYEVIGKKKGLSLLWIKLHTGRPHQIRVQLSSRNRPLYGDQKYGQEVNQPGQQIALWSQSLAFDHPTKKEQMKTSSLPPNTFPWNLWKEFAW
ncbi:RluA family pseudouridine synthase [Sediminibacillus massiliensis]|uniref:RluA family pseudouridine synthase n=1 Tax=Sediminibacillus massiliensis TaxID=1926277 RepID=UPI00098868D9|nr:RluA family pseudouridine synthase [Sediminibacillus massiliensis]